MRHPFILLLPGSLLSKIKEKNKVRNLPIICLVCMALMQDKPPQLVGDICPTHWRRISNALEIYRQDIGDPLPTDWQRISNVQQIYFVY